MGYTGSMSTPNDFSAVLRPSRKPLQAGFLLTVVAVTLVAIWAVACGDGATEPAPTPNRAPLPSGSIPAQTVAVGETATVNVAGYFTDPDGDALTFAATSSNPQTATVAASSGVVTVTAIERGEVTVTVTAMDPGGLSAQGAFTVTVPNQAPVAVNTVPPQTVFIGDTVQVDMAAYFNDPDGDAVTYSASSSNAAAASAAVVGSVVSIGAGATGTAVITVTATDPDGLSAQHHFEVTVPNRAPLPVGSLTAQTLAVGQTVAIDVSPLFDDPDNDPLTYKATTTDSAVAVATISDNLLMVTGSGRGEASVIVTATDPGGLSASLDVELAVVNDRPALVAVYDATNGSGWRRGDYWATSAPLEDWYGLIVRGPIVLEVDLSNNGLRGVLPSELGMLTQLESLDLSENVRCDRRCVGLSRLVGSGRLVRAYGPIPSEIGNLTRLRRLDLSRTGLTGPIPRELGDLTSLEVLDLSINDLRLDGGPTGGPRYEGKIPPEVGKLAGLKHLDLSENGLRTRIPPELGNLESLEWLNLARNGFDGPIPLEIGNLRRLEHLDLSETGVSGVLPRTLGGLVRLRYLDLSGTHRLTGGIPPALGDLAQLEYLDLSGTDRLTGGIPPELGNLAQLEYLDLSKGWCTTESGLSGPLPPELGRLERLEHLDIRCNPSLGTGPIPMEFTKLTNLKTLLALHTNVCAPADSAFQAWLSGVQHDLPTCSS